MIRMLEIYVLIALNYVFLSLLVVAYAAWRYLKRQKKPLLYFTLCFAFQALSAIFQMFGSTMVRGYLGIRLNVTGLRLLELGGLALFAGFTLFAIIALRKSTNSR